MAAFFDVDLEQVAQVVLAGRRQPQVALLQLGPVWGQTVVLVATEFGRTVAANGTGGTDHGTASAAMLVGGAVQGGRILADWPGLAHANLFEGRDLKPTSGLDMLIASTCAEAFNLDPERTARTLFPSAVWEKSTFRLLRT